MHSMFGHKTLVLISLFASGYAFQFKDLASFRPYRKSLNTRDGQSPSDLGHIKSWAALGDSYVSQFRFFLILTPSSLLAWLISRQGCWHRIGTTTGVSYRAKSRKLAMFALEWILPKHPEPGARVWNCRARFQISRVLWVYFQSNQGQPGEAIERWIAAANHPFCRRQRCLSIRYSGRLCVSDIANRSHLRQVPAGVGSGIGSDRQESLQMARWAV